MRSSAACLLYTQDDRLVRRASTFLGALGQLRIIQQPDRIEPVLFQTGPALLLLDLRAAEGRDLVHELPLQWPQLIIIALGVVRSEPLREAEESGIYAAEDVNIDRRKLQALVSRALDHLRLQDENRALREQSALVSTRVPAQATPAVMASSFSPVLRFPRVFRRYATTEMLMDRLIENLADTTRVGRVGIFSQTRQSDRFRLGAGLRCLPETHEIEFSARDPLVRWFELHAHLISRAELDREHDPEHRQVLRRALDSLGAEVIVPLHRGELVSGWLFFGHRVTGETFDRADLETLMILAEHVSTVLENARLHEELTREKTLAETLLAAVPPGVVAIDEDAVVRWFNPTAASYFGITAERVVGKPIENVSSRLASLLRDTLEGADPAAAEDWIDPRTRRNLSIQTRRLTSPDASLGAVAVIEDRTSESLLRQKQELLDRAAFWTDLAASMSHEVRNPLVAIKTFAQLLPERFDDPDFRRDFNTIVVQEIDRLDQIITQINNFAHPPELHLKAIDLRAPMKKAIELARSRATHNGFALETALPNDLPRIVGDEDALAEAFAHLMTNAAEAAANQPRGRVTITAKPITEGRHTSGVVVTVQDNGKGISPELRDKIFSPFCTTKARGMGLGLPIVKRTIFDHNGRVDVDSNPTGTSVSVLLPVAEEDEA